MNQDYRSHAWLEITERWGRAKKDKKHRGKEVWIEWKGGVMHHRIGKSGQEAVREPSLAYLSGDAGRE
jgi:hypothetical protein